MNDPEKLLIHEERQRQDRFALWNSMVILNGIILSATALISTSKDVNLSRYPGTVSGDGGNLVTYGKQRHLK